MLRQGREAMSKLIVIAFKDDRFKASEVLNKLLQIDREWAVQLNHAAAVYRDQNGELRVDEKYELTPDDGAAPGMLWGSLIGTLLAIPIAAVTGGLAAAAALTVGAAGGGSAGAIAGALDVDRRNEGFGISVEFIQEAGSMLQSGDSAIFAVLHADYPEKVIKKFEGTGGKVLVTSLSDEQRAMIEKALDSASG